MKKLVAAIASVLPLSAYPAPINMKPGLWEFKGDMGHAQNVCYSKQDLRSLDAMLQAAARRGGTTCRWFDVEGTGNTWTYKQACKYGGSPETTSEVKNTFNGDTAEMLLTSAGSTFVSKGKWLGPCK